MCRLKERESPFISIAAKISLRDSILFFSVFSTASWVSVNSTWCLTWCFTAAEYAGLRDQPLCHQLVCFQEVFDGVRVESHNLVVGFVGVFDLFDFRLLAGNHFPLNDGGHFAEREGVALNGEGGMNRPHTVFAVQFYITLELRPELKARNGLNDFRE